MDGLNRRPCFRAPGGANHLDSEKYPLSSVRFLMLRHLLPIRAFGRTHGVPCSFEGANTAAAVGEP